MFHTRIRDPRGAVVVGQRVLWSERYDIIVLRLGGVRSAE